MKRAKKLCYHKVYIIFYALKVINAIKGTEDWSTLNFCHEYCGVLKTFFADVKFCYIARKLNRAAHRIIS